MKYSNKINNTNSPLNLNTEPTVIDKKNWHVHFDDNDEPSQNEPKPFLNKVSKASIKEFKPENELHITEKEKEKESSILNYGDFDDFVEKSKDRVISSNNKKHSIKSKNSKRLANSDWAGEEDEGAEGDEEV